MHNQIITLPMKTEANADIRFGGVHLPRSHASALQERPVDDDTIKFIFSFARSCREHEVSSDMIDQLQELLRNDLALFFSIIDVWRVSRNLEPRDLPAEVIETVLSSPDFPTLISDLPDEIEVENEFGKAHKIVSFLNDRFRGLEFISEREIFYNRLGQVIDVNTSGHIWAKLFKYGYHGTKTCIIAEAIENGGIVGVRHDDKNSKRIPGVDITSDINYASSFAFNHNLGTSILSEAAKAKGMQVDFGIVLEFELTKCEALISDDFSRHIQPGSGMRLHLVEPSLNALTTRSKKQLILMMKGSGLPMTYDVTWMDEEWRLLLAG